MSADSFPSISDLLAPWRGLPLPFPPLLSHFGQHNVRLALAQLTGYAAWRTAQFDFGIAPVPLSFGWATFGFCSIKAVLFNERLIPSSGRRAFVTNCADYSPWTNQSWILEQLLGTFESDHKVVGTDSSMCIGLFELERFIEGEKPQHARDRVWWAGWTIIAIQLGVALVPWSLHGNPAVPIFVMSGTAMTLLISALPQWREEKWSGSMSKGESAHILRREHGQHVMVFKGSRGSYDLNTLATSQPQMFPQNPLVMLIVAPLCACLLMCTAYLTSHSWFLAGIGGLGMLYNVYAAGMQRPIEKSGLKIRRLQKKPSIVVTLENGKSQTQALNEIEQLIPKVVSGPLRKEAMRWLLQQSLSINQLSFSLDIDVWTGG